MERVEEETEEEYCPGGTAPRVGAVVWRLGRLAVEGGAGTDRCRRSRRRGGTPSCLEVRPRGSGAPSVT